MPVGAGRGGTGSLDLLEEPPRALPRQRGLPVRRERKKVESLFAHLKRILKLDRLRLRGLSGANDEFILSATVQNLRRLAKLCGQAPPDDRIGAPA
ncbi:MAG: transposase [Pseudomonadota bacterium]|nr:transposase [Pseudomonadota bacterium]